MMNLKEGTRRLALLLGVVGAILGGFASYLGLQSVLEQRASYAKFEQLANSDVVNLKRKDCLSDDPPPGYAKLASQLQENTAGIKIIYWADDCKVVMIETDDWDWLSPELAPGGWEYLLIGLLPILGFFIPWVAVCAIGWVGTGFVTGSK